MTIRIFNSRHEIHDEIKEIVIHYLEKQNAQSHSNMLVVRGVQQIQSVYSECKRVEHIQYPELWVASMELQALECRCTMYCSHGALMSMPVRA